ncbi:MAG: ABC transporter ATP-binding protein [Xanthomonadales bacterium]
MSGGASEPLIRLRDVYRIYEMGDQALHALDGVTLDIGQNEYVAIVGASGSGKSTLMNILGCLDRASRGDYVLNGTDVSDMNENRLAAVRNREIGFVFQTFNLLARASALKNVMQPLVYRGIPRAERKRLATEALERVGLGERVESRPNQLSGGQRQRVAIARALVGEPAILLADEPTGNLDSQTSRDIMALIDRVHAEGQTVIMVTHEPDIAAHCHRIIRLTDGRVESDERRHVQVTP